jgi:hypothetical protein
LKSWSQSQKSPAIMKVRIDQSTHGPTIGLVKVRTDQITHGRTDQPTHWTVH